MRFGLISGRLAGVVVVAVCVAAAVASPAAAASRHATPTPRSGVSAPPSWATHNAVQGPAPASAPVQVNVILKLRNAAGAEQLAQAVSTPHNAQYHHYINAATFHARFSPTQSTANAIATYLRHNGFRVGAIPGNRLFVSGTGTVAAAQRAFGVTLDNYHIHGSTQRAPTGNASLPQSLAQDVAGVDGLSSGVGTSQPDHAFDRTSVPSTSAAGPALPGPPPALVNAPPCSTYWGQKTDTTDPPAYGQRQFYAPCGYTPAQFRGAYGVQPLVSNDVDGRGETVAIVDAYAAPTIRADANQYSANRGEPQFTTTQFRQMNAASYNSVSACDPQGWYGEETLDVESIHGMAPGANIIYAGAASCNDMDLLNRENVLVDRQVADVISNSWGGVGDIDQLPPNLQQAYTQLFLQAVTEGIGIQFSSGDEGDEIADAGFRTVDFPSSDPWVTAVGGTSLGVGASNNYLFEDGWGTDASNLVKGAWSPNPPGDFLYGAGGGTSQVFNEPFYQDGVVPASLTGYFGGDGRVVPDIAMDADPQTGMLIGETQHFPSGANKYSEYRIGGTSLACPLLAGMMALADEASGVQIGFANPNLYGLSGTSAIRDVSQSPKTLAVVRNNYNNGVNASGGITPSLRTFNETGTLKVTPGYDDVTGLGTPDGLSFISAVGFS